MDHKILGEHESFLENAKYVNYVVGKWHNIHTDSVVKSVHRKGKSIIRISINELQKTCSESETEFEFYHNVLPAYSLDVQSFFPKCYSVDAEKFLINIEDITFGNDCPVMLDIKIGFQTLPSPCTEKHIKKDHQTTSSVLGHRITGYTHYNGSRLYMAPQDDLYKIHNKEEEMIHLKKYFTDSNNQFRRDVIQNFIRQLQKILKWKQEDSNTYFYSSSILFVYSSTSLPNHFVECTCKIIDLSHNVMGIEKGCDSNFSIGLSNLIDNFGKLE